MRLNSSVGSAGFLILCSALVSGCGVGSLNTTSSTHAAVQGRLMGGQQPVSGSSIQMYAAGSGGYGSASSALLSTPAITDANGSFTITTPYTCPSSTTPVYVVARGGNPGLGGTVDNSALTLMAALGPCGNLSSSTHVVISEVTTVAAVWALAPFMTAYDHVGTSSTNAVGLTNAFSMAANLASAGRGQSPGDAPAGSVIPSAELNTLANVLASCVNTSGGTGSTDPCGKLFADTSPATGPLPTETVGAALNIALHPAQNASDLYTLASPTGPFQPTLTAAPNDWTVAVAFALPGTPNGMALDANGNMWVQAASLQELSPSGNILGSYSAMTGSNVSIDASGNIWAPTSATTISKMPPTLGTPTAYSIAALNLGILSAPGYLANDAAGNVWFSCGMCGFLGKLTADGTGVTSYPLSINRTTNAAIDQIGNIWVGNITAPRIDVLTSSGAKYGSEPFSCGTCSDPAFVAIDSFGNGWTVGFNATKISPSGSATSYAGYPNSSGGLNSGQGVAIDGAGNAWIVNNINISNAYNGALTEISNSGTFLTPFLGYVSSTLSTPYRLAIDGSGNVWVASSGASTLSVFVGAATPVVTPFALGLANGTLATKP